MKKLATLLFAVSMVNLNAQEAQLLKDIATRGEGTFRYDAEIFSYTVNNQMYFYFDHEQFGRELWRTNGSEVGTQMVKDIAPGLSNSNPSFVGSFDNLLLFNASIPDSGSFLFTSTGSSTSTHPLMDNDGNPVSRATDPVMVDDVLYFFSGTDIYRTQGTPESTYSVVDLSELNFSYKGGLTVIGELFFFRAYTLESGYEIWVSDGTTGGTQLLKDINPGIASSDVIGRFVVSAGDNQFYFLAEDAVHGKELWTSDGTPQGTVMIKDFTPGSEDSNLTFLGVVNDILYFIYRESNINRYIWKTDGTEEGTEKLPGDIRGNALTMFKEELYFRGDGLLWKANGSSELQLTDQFIETFSAVTDDWLYYLVSSNEGISLWRTDGLEEGEEFIRMVTDKSYYDVENLFAAGENIFFTCETDSFGIELWASDGTKEGTQIMIDSRPGPEDGFESYWDVKFGHIGEKLIYAGYDEENGRELWVSDATPEGTRLIRDLTPRTVDVFIRGVPVEYKGASFFLADTSLWLTDGTPEGTKRVRNFQSSNNDGLQVFNNQLVFSADYPELGRTLWTSDGTSEGTKPVFDTSNNKTTRMLMFQENPVYNGAIYFQGLNEFGYELWKTDGTVDGTYMVKDIWEGSQQSYLNLRKGETVELNGSLFFGAANEILGYELWKTDGTEEGTVPITDINPQGNSGVSNLTLLDKRILFTAQDGSSGNELWSTDGTIDGTMMIKDIYPGEKSGITSGFIKYKDHIYFQGEGEGLGRELWRTDGTKEGTELFIDLFPEEGWSRPSNFQIIENQLYFLAFSEEGKKLFKTDGTVEGTQQVSDAEIDNSYLHAEGVIFYDTYSDINGNQLWRMHLGEGEPRPVQGVPQGNRSGAIQLLNYTNNTLFFSGFDNNHGREIWALSPLEASVSIEMTGKEICSTEDTLTLQAIAMNTGDEPVFIWHINGVAVAGENSQKIALTGLQDGDEIKVSAEADNELWLINDNPESEIFTVSYNNPAAEITVNQNTLSANQGTSYIWYLNGSALNESSQSLTVTESGTYTVEVFYESGCSSLSNPVTVEIDPTGLGLLSGTMDMEVFPNPAIDIIKLRSPMDRHLTLNITNLNGERVYSRNIELFKGEEYEIAVGNLPNGIYIIQGISGSDTFIKRMIIQ